MRRRGGATRRRQRGEVAVCVVAEGDDLAVGEDLLERAAGRVVAEARRPLEWVGFRGEIPRRVVGEGDAPRRRAGPLRGRREAPVRIVRKGDGQKVALLD